jgi:ferredoxin
MGRPGPQVVVFREDGSLDTESRELAGLTIRIDRRLCVGFETCVQVEPTLFALDAEGIATFRAEADPMTADRVLEACRACPVDALEVLNASGERLVP